MAITDAAIIRRSLTSRTFSSVVTALSVAVGVALMLTMLATQNAANSAFRRGTGNCELLISRDASPLVSVLNAMFYAGAPARPIAFAEYTSLVERYPFAFALPTQQGDSFKGRPVMATVPEFFTLFEPAPGTAWSFAAGRAFAAPFEVVVGSEAAAATGLRLGDRISLTHGTPTAGESRGHEHREFSYEVVGVLAQSFTPHDRALFTDLTSAWILHAHDRRLKDLGPDAPLTTEADLIDDDRKITGIYAKVLSRPGTQTSAALQQVFTRLRTDPSLTVASPSDQVGRLLAIVGRVDIILYALAAAVIASSGITIMLAMYNTMEHRRRQIAVFRVLGCSRPRVLGLVLTESAVLGLAGAAAGVALAAVGGFIVSRAIRATLNLVLEPSVSPRAAVAVVLATVALATLAGLIPAVAAYRTSVIRNLRPLA